MRSALIFAMLRQVESFTDRFGMSDIPEDLIAKLKELASLKDNAYRELALAA